MVENPRPTRAEVSDVANAIRMGTDAIMTSDETTVGKYPIETIKMMSKIAVEVEKEFDERINDLPPTKNDSEIPVYLARAAVKSTLKLPVKAIVVDTQTGRSARYLSSIRGSKPIFAQCYDETVMRQLTLSYGVYVSSMMKTDDMQKFIGVALESLLNTKEFKKEDLVVILAGSFGPSHGASFIEISSISNLLGVSKKK
jgi:pyruvate kinase